MTSIETTGNGLSGAIADALETDGWESSIAAVQDLLARQLTSLDSEARIERTDYFNHSFIPDFVLSWENKQIKPRHVFLRTDQSHAGLQMDLDLVGGSSPILIALSPFTKDGGIDPLSNDDPKDDGTLVADPVSVGIAPGLVDVRC